MVAIEGLSTQSPQKISTGVASEFVIGLLSLRNGLFCADEASADWAASRRRILGSPRPFPVDIRAGLSIVACGWSDLLFLSARAPPDGP
jgi:hypothetical protein